MKEHFRETMGVGIKEGEVKELSAKEETGDIENFFFWKETGESIIKVPLDKPGLKYERVQRGGVWKKMEEKRSVWRCVEIHEW